MTYLDTWRTNLKAHLSEFAPLANEDRSINLIYGITAAAVLWGVRDANFSEEQRAALREACGDQKHLEPLLRAVAGWDDFTRLEAARKLSMRQGDSDELRDALTTLMGTFIEELFEQNMVQRQHIDISGTISGGNIIIGGYQIVAGDMVIQHITQQKIRACPTAPKPPAHFAGRRDELNRLKEVLGQGQSVAITGIQGVGGIGKTALSLQLASEMSEFSAVLWASLGPNPNTGNQLIEWARHADPDFDPGQDDLDMLVSRVQALLTNLIQDECPGRVLVILDDIWEGDAVRAARTLQKAAPVNSVSLITTRSQRVVAQLRSTRLELQPMTPQDALQMLLNLLSDYPDIPDNTLLELAEVVGYHPLAMELAAGQVTLLERPVQEIAEQIERYRRGIPAGSPFRDIGLELGEDREDNLEVVLAFSYDSLTEIEQAQFRALGVLAYNAPFDRDICRTIWAVEDSKPALDSLRHRALLNIADDEGWYQQHVLLRNYARIMLTKQNELSGIFHLYTDISLEKVKEFDNLPQKEWSQLSLYLPHVDYVGDELYQLYSENRTTLITEQLGDFAWNAATYVTNQPRMVEAESTKVRRGLNWLLGGLEIYQHSGQKSREARILNSIGIIYTELGRKHEALDYLHNAEKILSDAKDDRNYAATLSNIGHVNTDLGNKQISLDYYWKALPIRKRIGDISGEAITLTNIGGVYEDLGQKEKSLDYYRQAQVLFQATTNQLGEAIILNNIGRIYDFFGQKQKALDHYQQALEKFEAIDDKFNFANTLNNIGRVYADVGEKHHALDYYEQALSIRREIGDFGGEASTITNIGRVYDFWGNKKKALDYYQQAKDLFRTTHNRSGEATILNNIGYIYDYLGKKQQALAHYFQALALRKEVSDRPGEATTLNNIGSIYFDLGENQKALDYFQDALLIRQDVGDQPGKATTLNSIGSIYVNLDEYDKALDYFQKALVLRQEVKDPDGEATTLNNMSYIYFKKGDIETTIKLQKQIISIVRSIGDHSSEALYLYNIATVYERIGKIEDAIKAVEEGRDILLKLNLEYSQGGVNIDKYTEFLEYLKEGKSHRIKKLPEGTIDNLAKNTIAVMTNVSNKHDEWSKQVTSLVKQANENQDLEILEFFIALQAILESRTPIISEDSSYIEIINMIIKAIKEYRK